MNNLIYKMDELEYMFKNNKISENDDVDMHDNYLNEINNLYKQNEILYKELENKLYKMKKDVEYFLFNIKEIVIYEPNNINKIDNVISYTNNSLIQIEHKMNELNLYNQELLVDIYISSIVYYIDKLNTIKNQLLRYGCINF